MNATTVLIQSIVSGMFLCYLPLVLFLLIQTMLGKAFLRIPLFRSCLFQTRTERLLFSTFIGFYLSYLLFTGLALIGLLNPYSLLLYAVLSVLAALYSERRAILEIPSFLKAGRLRINRVWILWGLVCLVLSVWILPVFLQTLLPNTDWDSALVHLPLSKHFLEQGLLTLDPMRPTYAVPGAIHLFYAAFFAVGCESSITPFNFAILLLTVVGAYALAARFWGRKAGLWSAAVLLSSNIMIELGLDPRIDGFLAAFTLMSLFAFLLWIHDSYKLPYLVICAVMLGLAVGTKATGVFPVGILSLFILVSGTRHYSSKKPLFFKHVLLFFLIVAIPSGIWYGRNLAAFGDPIYPRHSGRFYYSRTGERKVLREALAPYLSNADSPGIQQFKRRIETKYPAEARDPAEAGPKTLFNLLEIFRQQTKGYEKTQQFRQTDYARKPYHFMSPLLVLFFFLPLVRRDRVSLVLYAAGMMLFFLMGVQTHLLRYALFVMPILSIGTALLISRIQHIGWRVGWGIILCILLFQNGVREWEKYSGMESSAFFSGKLDRLAWLSHVGYSSSPSTPKALHAINTYIRQGVISPDSTILMVYEGKGRLLDCNHIDDDSWIGAVWLAELIESDLDYDRLADSFRAKGIDYILVNQNFVTWLLLRAKANKGLIAFNSYHLDRFLRQHSHIVYQKHGILLARLH